MRMFGDELRARRKDLRLGLREFALRAGVDPGNLSKIERGRLTAPQSDEVLERICLALEFEPGSDGAQALKDLAAAETGRIPPEVLDDQEVMVRMPVLLRTVHNKKLGPEELDRLIEMIKEA
ncbi:MAG: helix-turn-helix transcriptional regulator [Gemmatimonadota bacterium]